MQKVSRAMLAVVAAIQSGAHTRRKPKYIKERALVSSIYPIRATESIYVPRDRIANLSEVWYPREKVDVTRDLISSIVIKTYNPYLKTNSKDSVEAPRDRVKSIEIVTYNPRISTLAIDSLAAPRDNIKAIAVTTVVVNINAEAEATEIQRDKIKSIKVETMSNV